MKIACVIWQKLIKKFINAWSISYSVKMIQFKGVLRVRLIHMSIITVILGLKVKLTTFLSYFKNGDQGGLKFHVRCLGSK
jgi:hypothetical protein